MHHKMKKKIKKWICLIIWDNHQIKSLIFSITLNHKTKNLTWWICMKHHLCHNNKLYLIQHLLIYKMIPQTIQGNNQLIKKSNSALVQLRKIGNQVQRASIHIHLGEDRRERIDILKLSKNLTKVHSNWMLKRLKAHKGLNT